MVSSESSDVLGHVAEGIVVVERQGHIGLRLAHVMDEVKERLVVITDVFLLNFLPDLFCGVFFLHGSEVIVDGADLSLGGGVPGLDDLHGLCYIAVEGQDFLELSD